MKLGREEWSMEIMNTKSFLLWLLSLSLVFFLSFMFSSNPFTSIYNQPGIINFWRPVNETIKNSGDVANCNIFSGKWERDYSGPGYRNTSCRTLPDSKNCGKYGKGQDFVNWRWKPDGCELPRFDAVAFLEIVQGKTMAFVGDSVGRNQMESLLCLLSQIEDPLGVKEENEDAIRSWYFQSYDFTLKLLWTKFLVESTERVVNGSSSGVTDLHLDKVDTNWTQKLPLINYLIISDGHWFWRQLYLYENEKIIGCIFCSDAHVKNFPLEFAIRKTFRTALQFINKCEDCKGLLSLVRTFTPAHFENGAWDTGGNCNRTMPVDESEISLSGTDWKVRNAQVEELESLRKGERGKWFGLLDVTRAMMMRPDAHPGTHWDNQWMKGYNDCVHWCLPGPVDTWNEMLLALLKRRPLDELLV